ncbi:FecR domain-containing protein [Orrella sp. JC864]|uniref:FecR family protein n=1 Tax=Orrella sp. JC864 TaxID=3120298 RepID=UPI00300A49C5
MKTTEADTGGRGAAPGRQGVPALLLEQARALVCEFGSGKPGTADRDRILAWRARSHAHEAAWRQACTEWREIGTAAAGVPVPGIQGAAAPRPPVLGRRLFLAGTAAAAAGLAGVAVMRPPWGLWPSWAEMGADYRTRVGERRDISIEPGVTVALNTRSSLRTQSATQGVALRLVSGDAVLSTQGRPCVLQAGRGRISTRDGEIEVSSLDGEQVHVRCGLGQAMVWHPGGEMPLRPGERLRYDAQRIERLPGTQRESAAWRRGMLEFENAPLSEVVEQINRYRPGHVFLQNGSLAGQRLSAHFSTDALDEAIAHIGHLFGASIRRLTDGIVIIA